MFHLIQLKIYEVSKTITERLFMFSTQNPRESQHLCHIFYCFGPQHQDSLLPTLISFWTEPVLKISLVKTLSKG